MKIRLKQGFAGADFSHQPGEVVDWPENAAQRLIDRDLAEAAPNHKRKKRTEQVETTSVEPPENAAKRTTRPRGRRAK